MVKIAGSLVIRGFWQFLPSLLPMILKAGFAGFRGANISGSL